VFVQTVIDALIDGFESGFQCFVKSRQRFLDRRQQDRRTYLAQYSVFVLPTRIVD